MKFQILKLEQTKFHQSQSSLLFFINSLPEIHEHTVLAQFYVNWVAVFHDAKSEDSICLSPKLKRLN